MRDYKGYRLYIGTHFGGEAGFITRNDSDRVWGIGRVFNDAGGVVEARARVETWEQDPGDPWRDGHLFNRSEYTNVRELEIDPSQREERVRTGTATYVNSPNTDKIRYFVEVDGDERVYFSRQSNRDAAATYLRSDEDRTLDDPEATCGYGQGRDRAAYRASYYTDVKYDDTPEEETVSEEIDYKAAYEKTIEALRKEAEKRGWCTEFDEFVKDNNLPETLTETKVRVTLELTIPSRNVTIDQVRNAVAETRPGDGVVDNRKITKWETI